MSDSETDDLNDDQWEQIRNANVKPGMFVSGWDDPDELIVEDNNPDGKIPIK